MIIRKILVPMDGSEQDRAALTAAFSVAGAFDAHVAALYVHFQPTDVLPFVGEGMSAALVQELVELTERESTARAGIARKTFEAMREAAGLLTASTPSADRAGGPSASWREADGQQEDTIVRAGRVADLTVFARPGTISGPGRPSTFSAALFESGRPVLVAAANAAPLRLQRIVVAWDGSAQASRGLAASLPFLAQADEVSLVMSREGRDEDEELTDVAAYLAWHGVRAGHRIVAPYPSTAEALAAAAIRADLLVMGGYSHSRLREMILGGVTRHMLERTSLPLLLAH